MSFYILRPGSGTFHCRCYGGTVAGCDLLSCCPEPPGKKCKTLGATCGNACERTPILEYLECQ
jgi:hypothetical protein